MDGVIGGKERDPSFEPSSCDEQWVCVSLAFCGWNVLFVLRGTTSCGEMSFALMLRAMLLSKLVVIFSFLLALVRGVFVDMLGQTNKLHSYETGQTKLLSGPLTLLYALLAWRILTRTL